jgi:hypothetical protein
MQQQQQQQSTVVCLLLAQLLNAARGALGQRAISCASGMRRWNSTSRDRHHSAGPPGACPQRHDVEQRLAAQHVLQYAHADTDAAAAEARQRSRQQAICTPAWAQHQAQPSVSYLFDASTLQGRCSLAHRQQKGCRLSLQLIACQCTPVCAEQLPSSAASRRIRTGPLLPGCCVCACWRACVPEITVREQV